MSRPESPPRRRRRRWPVVAAAVLTAVPVAIVVGVWLFLRGSLPALDGRLPADVNAPVEVSRDGLGAVTVRGAERGDVAWATGFAHAQDRWFQMDLLRRAGAGELAALLGPRLVAIDRQRRIHRFRKRATEALATVPPAQRLLLDRYVAGVNAGLAALSARPFEYALLRAQPVPWQAADSLLVVYAMYFDLQDDQMARLLSRGLLRDHGTTAGQLAALLPEASAYDAPLDAPAITAPSPPLPASAPAWWGPPASSPGADRTASIEPTDAALATGSNDAAISGTRSATGAAIVSVDMHLALRLPNFWYRTVLEVGARDAPAASRTRLVGMTLPGTPLLVVGSNGRVAWGFTNSYSHALDLVELDLDPSAPTRYRTSGEAWSTLRSVDERIDVAGTPAETLHVEESEMGPVRRWGGKAYAVRWVAHDPGAASMTFVAMESAATVDDALAAGEAAGLPAQNLIAGDAAGRIGWTVAGPLPDRRTGFAATFPRAASAPAGDAQDWRAFATTHPRIVDPPSGQLSTANGRQLAGDDASRIGDGGFDLGARGRQLRDGLAALGAKTDEAGVYGTMLDDRALYLAPWRDRLLRALAKAPADAASATQRAEFERVVASTWTGRASVDSAAYTLTRAWIGALYRRLFGSIDETLRAVDAEASFARATPRWPAVVARLLDERPPGWLPAGARDWHEVELAAVDDAAADVLAGIGVAGATGDRPARLADARWGRRNTARIAHPLATALPLASHWLAAPADELPGDSHMPRVSAPSFGQSERLVVSPGHEETGLFAMPGGQSGHPMSPWFLAGHAAWAGGNRVPLLPGPAVHTLTLIRSTPP